MWFPDTETSTWHEFYVLSRRRPYSRSDLSRQTGTLKLFESQIAFNGLETTNHSVHLDGRVVYPPLEYIHLCCPATAMFIIKLKVLTLSLSGLPSVITKNLTMEVRKRNIENVSCTSSSSSSSLSSFARLCFCSWWRAWAMICKTAKAHTEISITNTKRAHSLTVVGDGKIINNMATTK